MTEVISSSGSPQSARWVERLRDANVRLQNDPSHRDAWQWQIEMRILSYLISRYGDAEHRESRPLGGATSGHRCGTAAVAPVGFGLQTGTGIREILERIALANIRSKSMSGRL